MLEVSFDCSYMVSVIFPVSGKKDLFYGVSSCVFLCACFTLKIIPFCFTFVLVRHKLESFERGNLN